MKRAHLWQDIRPSYFGPGLRQNLTVSGKKGLGLTSYGLGFFGVVPGRPPTEAPPWPGYSIFVKWVIQIVGDPHHTGSCPALVSELFKNRLSPLASKQAKRKKWLFCSSYNSYTRRCPNQVRIWVHTRHRALACPCLLAVSWAGVLGNENSQLWSPAEFLAFGFFLETPLGCELIGRLDAITPHMMGYLVQPYNHWNLAGRFCVQSW